jgi:hypothetical protein
MRKADGRGLYDLRSTGVTALRTAKARQAEQEEGHQDHLESARVSKRQQRVTIRNPNFHIDDAALENESARMRRELKALARPVVVLGGWHSPGLANWGVESVLLPHTSGKAEDFLSVTYPMKVTLRGSAEAAIEAMRARGMWDREVDLVGISMGGVLARAIACGAFGHGDRAVKRIFTIATPHRGAKIASIAILDGCAWDMRPGSRFMTDLNARNGKGPELVCYGALRDWWIGASNTAPPGMHPHWVDVPPGIGRLCSHFAVNHDRRVLLDIARRLRGEAPIAGQAAQPPRE